MRNSTSLSHASNQLQSGKRAGKKRNAPISLPTPEALKRFDERGITIVEQVVEATAATPRARYRRLIPQISTFLRQGKISQEIHDAFMLYRQMADTAHRAASPRISQYAPREFEVPSPDPLIHQDRTAEALRVVSRVKTRLDSEDWPYLEWAAPAADEEVAWRAQAKIWWPQMSAPKREAWFLSELVRTGLRLAEVVASVKFLRKHEI